MIKTNELALARQYLEIGRPSAALDVLDKFAVNANNDHEMSSMWLLRAHAHFALEEYRDSVNAAHDGLALNSESPGLLSILAHGLLAERNPHEAEKVLLRLLELEPENPKHLLQYAKLVGEAGIDPKARALVEMAGQIGADPLDLQEAKFDLAKSAGNELDADIEAMRLLALNPNDVHARWHLGFRKLLGGKLSSGRRLLTTIAAEAPQDQSLVMKVRFARLLSSPLLWPVWRLARFGLLPFIAVTLALFWDLIHLGFRNIAYPFVLTSFSLLAVFTYLFTELTIRFFGRSGGDESK